MSLGSVSEELDARLSLALDPFEDMCAPTSQTSIPAWKVLEPFGCMRQPNVSKFEQNIWDFRKGVTSRHCPRILFCSKGAEQQSRSRAA